MATPTTATEKPKIEEERLSRGVLEIKIARPLRKKRPEPHKIAIRYK